MLIHIYGDINKFRNWDEFNNNYNNKNNTKYINWTRFSETEK